ncbi:MAG: hypothetical protein QXT13_07660 [Pyrobaculum sp.]
MKKTTLPYKILDASMSATLKLIAGVGAAAVCDDGSLHFYRTIYAFKRDDELRKKCNILLSMIVRLPKIGKYVSNCISYTSQVFCGYKLDSGFVDAGGMHVLNLLKNVAKWMNVYKTRFEYELYAGDIRHDIKLDKVDGVVYSICAHRVFDSVATAEHYARVTSKLISPYLKRLERRGIYANVKRIHVYQDGVHVRIGGDVEYKYAGAFDVDIYMPSQEMVELFSTLTP